ncbi:unnamed protein product [Darwinula stevensoni]|uniref:BRCT domain-containing protein n=1 Tax=Darwinula stevensoni TaxID=69355 RepID=A0A7R8X8Q7_9CRUS|nr:unnamed protein product [Darwinula stevensoni]CAG0888221.1 unnamed protein product [Darwinula stevensoni]
MSPLLWEKKLLEVPSFATVIPVLQKGLEGNFSKVSVREVDCPDLTQSPFHLASHGLCGSPLAMDIGGVPYLFPSVNREKLYDLRDVSAAVGLQDVFMIGAGAGPWDYVGVNSEMMPNMHLGGEVGVQNCSHVSIVGKQGKCVLKRLPDDQPRGAVTLNIFASKGLPGKVIEVVAERRTGEENFISCMQKALKEEFKDSTIAVGGTFLIEKGKAKCHVMPDFSEVPLHTNQEVNSWLRFYNMSAPLICLSLFYSHDPGLDLRIEHTHCFSTHGEGGHYHEDVTPDEVSYRGYFNLASAIVRFDRPAATHSIDMDEIPATQVIDLGLDDSSSQDEEEEGKKVAELIVSESEKYPIYKGENRIGRNPDGSVDILLDHPVILEPEAWYFLRNGEALTFGNVKCIYAYVDEDEPLMEFDDPVPETEDWTSQSIPTPPTLVDEEADTSEKEERVLAEETLAPQDKDCEGPMRKSVLVIDESHLIEEEGKSPDSSLIPTSQSVPSKKPLSIPSKAEHSTACVPASDEEDDDSIIASTQPNTAQHLSSGSTDSEPETQDFHLSGVETIEEDDMSSGRSTLEMDLDADIPSPPLKPMDDDAPIQMGDVGSSPSAARRDELDEEPPHDNEDQEHPPESIKLDATAQKVPLCFSPSRHISKQQSGQSSHDNDEDVPTQIAIDFSVPCDVLEDDEDSTSVDLDAATQPARRDSMSVTEGDDEDIDVVSTQAVQRPPGGSNQVVKRRVNFIDPDAPTQLVKFHHLEEEIDFDSPTQVVRKPPGKYCDSRTRREMNEDIGGSDLPESVERDDEIKHDAPTQLFKSHVIEEDDDMPTQIVAGFNEPCDVLEDDDEEYINVDLDAATQPAKRDSASAVDEDDEDIDLVPTQVVRGREDTSQVIKKRVNYVDPDAPTQVVKVHFLEEEIDFDSPTQMVRKPPGRYCDSLAVSEVNEEKERCDLNQSAWRHEIKHDTPTQLFRRHVDEDAPTQMVAGCNEPCDVLEDDDESTSVDLDAATQPAKRDSVSVTKEDDEDLDLPAKEGDEDNHLAPTEVVRKGNEESALVIQRKVDDIDHDAPTQAIQLHHEEDYDFDAPTQVVRKPFGKCFDSHALREIDEEVENSDLTETAREHDLIDQDTPTQVVSRCVDDEDEDAQTQEVLQNAADLDDAAAHTIKKTEKDIDLDSPSKPTNQKANAGIHAPEGIALAESDTNLQEDKGSSSTNKTAPYGSDSKTKDTVLASHSSKDHTPRKKFRFRYEQSKESGDTEKSSNGESQGQKSSSSQDSLCSSDCYLPMSALEKLKHAAEVHVDAFNDEDVPTQGYDVSSEMITSTPPETLEMVDPNEDDGARGNAEAGSSQVPPSQELAVGLQELADLHAGVFPECPLSSDQKEELGEASTMQSQVGTMEILDGSEVQSRQIAAKETKEVPEQLDERKIRQGRRTKKGVEALEGSDSLEGTSERRNHKSTRTKTKQDASMVESKTLSKKDSEKHREALHDEEMSSASLSNQESEPKSRSRRMRNLKGKQDSDIKEGRSDQHNQEEENGESSMAPPPTKKEESCVGEELKAGEEAPTGKNIRGQRLPASLAENKSKGTSEIPVVGRRGRTVKRDKAKPEEVPETQEDASVSDVNQGSREPGKRGSRGKKSPEDMEGSVSNDSSQGRSMRSGRAKQKQTEEPDSEREHEIELEVKGKRKKVSSPSAGSSVLNAKDEGRSLRGGKGRKMESSQLASLKQGPSEKHQDLSTNVRLTPKEPKEGRDRRSQTSSSSVTPTCEVLPSVRDYGQRRGKVRGMGRSQSAAAAKGHHDVVVDAKETIDKRSDKEGERLSSSSSLDKATGRIETPVQCKGQRGGKGKGKGRGKLATANEEHSEEAQDRVTEEQEMMQERSDGEEQLVLAASRNTRETRARSRNEPVVRPREPWGLRSRGNDQIASEGYPAVALIGEEVTSTLKKRSQRMKKEKQREGNERLESVEEKGPLRRSGRGSHLTRQLTPDRGVSPPLKAGSRLKRSVGKRSNADREGQVEAGPSYHPITDSMQSPPKKKGRKERASHEVASAQVSGRLTRSRDSSAASKTSLHSRDESTQPLKVEPEASPSRRSIQSPPRKRGRKEMTLQENVSPKGSGRLTRSRGSSAISKTSNQPSDNSIQASQRKRGRKEMATPQDSKRVSQPRDSLASFKASQPVVDSRQMPPKKRGRRGKSPSEEISSQDTERQTRSQSSSASPRRRNPRTMKKEAIFTPPNPKEKLESSSDVSRGREKSRRTSSQRSSVGSSPVRKSSRVDVRPGPGDWKIMTTGIVLPDLLQKAITNMGGRVTTDEKEFNVLVTDCIHRTYKFLAAIARKVPIVPITWLTESRMQSAFSDPWKHLLVDKQGEQTFKFNLAKSLHKKEPLFSGYKFYITDGVLPSRHILTNLIEMSQGEVVESLPARLKGLQIVMVSCPEDKDQDKKVKNAWAKATRAGIPVVQAECILASICSQHFDVDQNRLG